MKEYLKKLITALLISTPIFANAQKWVPFEMDTDGHLFIKARINGVEGNFIFDTAAGATVISTDFAAKLSKLHKQDGSFTGFRETGEKLTSDVYTAEQLTIGSHREYKPTLLVINANFGPADGLISLTTFRESPFTIDFSNRKIIFENKEDLAELARKEKAIPLQLAIDRDKSLNVFAYMAVNDKLTLQIGLDSGAGAGVFHINAKFIPALGIDTATAKKIIHTSEFNPALKTVKYLAPLKSLRLKDQSEVGRSNIKALFVDGLIYDGIVSMDWLGKRVTFDLHHSRMFVEI